MLDLQQFCGTEETRPYLWKPFAAGDYSYATNGHIMVRVARREGDATSEIMTSAKAEGPLAGLGVASFSTPKFSLPGLDTDDACMACDGSGHQHSCPSCACPCSECEGSGKNRPKASVSIHGVPFDYRYLKQVLALPSVELATKADDNKPYLFRFEGGVGALMPLTHKRLTHFNAKKLARAA